MTKENHSIGCTVKDCAFHCPTQEYCTLQKIEVGCCDCHPMKAEGTCCQSFKKK